MKPTPLASLPSPTSQENGEDERARPRSKTRVGHASWNTPTTERRSITRRMRDEKMRTLGRLASNIAHEISTPTQFIGDNLHFLAGAFQTLRASIEALSTPFAQGDAEGHSDRLSGITSDLQLLDEEVNQAIKSSIDGIARIAQTVGAMRVYAHPDAKLVACDIVQILESTITIANAETKYVAETRTHLAHLPSIKGCPSELCQAFLNLLVNAAHAIADGARQRGAITVSAAVEGNCVVVAVKDDGCGIPAHIRTKVFEPRVTTKAVGRGTGQGLALAHAIIVDRHGGAIWFDTERAVGTTFYVRLPIAGPGWSDGTADKAHAKSIAETQEFEAFPHDGDAS